MDPQQRWLLEACYRALENGKYSGYPPGLQMGSNKS